MSPSAPTPKWRSHRARTSAGRRAAGRSPRDRARPGSRSPPRGAWCSRERSPSSRHRRSLRRPGAVVRRAGAAGARSASSAAPHGVGPVGFDPARSGDRAGTRPTAGGRRPGSGGRPLDHGLQRHPLLDVGQQLPVAEGLAGRARQPPGRAASARTSSSSPSSIQRSNRSAIRRSTASGSKGGRPGSPAVGG